MKSKQLIGISLIIIIISFVLGINSIRAREVIDDSGIRNVQQKINDCPVTGGGCIIGECFVTEKYTYTAGDCPGKSCEQLVSEVNAVNKANGSSITLSGDGLKSWTKYELILYKVAFSRNFSDSFVWRVLREAYSTSDKCSGNNSSNQCANEIGLWAGSCTSNAAGFYKCCCDNQTLKPVVSIPDSGNQDVYSPPEGVCPARSHVSWEKGAEISPNNCPNICANPRKCLNPKDCPDDYYCYASDLSTDRPVCDYGTIEELGIDPNLVSQLTAGPNPSLQLGISKEQCSYLCNDIYYCDLSDPANPEPKSLRGRFTSRDECIDYLDTDPSAPASTKDCFTKSDSAYGLCSPENSSLTGGAQGERPYFYCFTGSGYSCLKTSRSFPDASSCETYLESNKIQSDAKCYLLEGDCKDNCPKGPTANYFWCNPAGGGCLGSQPYTSKAECEKNRGTCYADFATCHASCGAASSGSASCDIPADSNPNDINLEIRTSDSCVPEDDNKVEVSWDASESNSLCSEGETTEDVSLSCKSICGGWTNTKIDNQGKATVNPNYLSSYGVSCSLAYKCCHNKVVYGDPYPCCDQNGENCKTCRDSEIKKICSNHSSQNSVKTEVKVVAKPEINSFTANPTDILYTDQARSSTYRKYSKLNWASFADYLGSETKISCAPKIKSGDGAGWTGNPLAQKEKGPVNVSPSKTTVYAIQCRNSDVKTPGTCFSDSDAKEATVRVFGAGIEEERPQSMNVIDLGKTLGNIIRALVPFER